MGMTYVLIMGGLVSILGTMIGAVLGTSIRNPSNKLIGCLIGFAGGLMLSVVVFELIPQSITSWSFLGTIMFCVIGVLITSLMDVKTSGNFTDSKKKVAFLVAAGLMFHNFPEGIIMGCGFAAGGALGIKMAVIICIHDIPEGIAVAAPLMAYKEKKSKILLYSLLTALPTAAGTYIGIIAGNVSQNILGICVSVASGIMLYVVCGEMMPESRKLSESISTTMGTIVGIILGLIITNVL